MSIRLIARSFLFESRTCFKLAETRSFASIFGQSRRNLSILQNISTESKAIRPQQIRFQSSQTPKGKEKKSFIVSLNYFKLLFNFYREDFLFILKHITWKSFIVVAIFGGALLVFKWKLEKDKEEGQTKSSCIRSQNKINYDIIKINSNQTAKKANCW